MFSVFNLPCQGQDTYDEFEDADPYSGGILSGSGDDFERRLQQFRKPTSIPSPPAGMTAPPGFSSVERKAGGGNERAYMRGGSSGGTTRAYRHGSPTTARHGFHHGGGFGHYPRMPMYPGGWDMHYYCSCFNPYGFWCYCM